MKSIIYILGMFLLLGSSACTDIIESKPGPRLPVVSNLAMEQVSAQEVRLTWDIPAAIPQEIEQPISVFIQVTEIVGVTKAISAFSTTLPDAAVEYTYTLPDPSKTYHLTVRLYGRTKEVDVNYSSDIYSEGQTVVYTP